MLSQHRHRRLRFGTRDDGGEGDAQPKHSGWRKEERQIHGTKMIKGMLSGNFTVAAAGGELKNKT
jgi:hypothetical protein